MAEAVVMAGAVTAGVAVMAAAATSAGAVISAVGAISEAVISAACAAAGRTSAGRAAAAVISAAEGTSVAGPRYPDRPGEQVSAAIVRLPAVIPHGGLAARNGGLAGRNAGLAGRNAAVRSAAVRHAMGSRSVAGALHNRGALHNPGTRAQIAATAATAGWHNRGGGGWWQHGNGGYGWVGPLFWPFAYYDMSDYALWGYGYDPSFWGYGYGDIYAGIFAPYGYDDLTGYLPSGGGRNSAGATPATQAANPPPDELSQMCGEGSREIAGLPIDQIQQAIQPDDAQRTALDDLANASMKAAQTIKAACPTQIVLTAPGRLAAMESRIEAMIAAVGIVQPPLDHFYGLLNDEQKARLTALGQDQREARRARTGCGQRRGPARAGLWLRAVRCDGLAGRRDRAAAASDRSAARGPHRPEGGQRQGGGNAQSLLRAGYPADAAGAARRRRQSARHHAASGRDGEGGA